MTDLFTGISNKNKVKLLYTLESHSFNFKKNTRILTNINNMNFIGIVVDGSLQITRYDYNGNRTIIETLEQNSIFGSTISSLHNNEYDVITIEDSKIIIIDYNRIINEDFNTSYFNQFVKNLLEIITEKINEKNERIEILTKKSIRDKLLEYFKISSNKIGSRVIYLPFNYTSLADYLAVDRCAMTRELKNLIDEGFIKKENKKITLLYNKVTF